ncbi:enoyl-CoA hydratase-related protein [Nocardioides alcanivorans]|uniref:enoyl-CoA hydratase-related protein n=1 Tax=Nocardioides alcanivorans TaxID=2897352 RepID=UPI0024B1A300|nr:enoyl-CoA hydratase-related protein [Nocardioides alcanivorans]
MTELVKYAVTAGIATLTFDSPHNRNALSRQLLTEFQERMERAAADADVRVVVIRAEGRTFCSGADLSEASSGTMEEGRWRSWSCSAGSQPTPSPWSPACTGRCARAASGSSRPPTWRSAPTMRRTP